MLLALHFKVLPWGKTVLRLSSAVKWDCQSDKRLVKFWPLRLSRLLLRWLGWAEWLQVLQAMATLKASYHEHWSKAEHPEASCWWFMRFSAAGWISTWNNNNPHNGLASFLADFRFKSWSALKEYRCCPKSRESCSGYMIWDWVSGAWDKAIWLFFFTTPCAGRLEATWKLWF